MADECLFCKMIKGEIKPETVYEDDDVLAFKDINPQAPVHVLIVPKQHIPTINDLEPGTAAITGKLLLAAKTVAQDYGIARSGYRAVMNCNADAGQTVFHLHMHVLGGRYLRWPPG